MPGNFFDVKNDFNLLSLKESARSGGFPPPPFGHKPNVRGATKGSKAKERDGWNNSEIINRARWAAIRNQGLLIR